MGVSGGNRRGVFSRLLGLSDLSGYLVRKGWPLGKVCGLTTPRLPTT